MERRKDMKFAFIICGCISPNHIIAARKSELDFCAICDIMPVNIEDNAGQVRVA